MMSKKVGIAIEQTIKKKRNRAIEINNSSTFFVIFGL